MSLIGEAAVDCINVLRFISEWTRKVRGRFLNGVNGCLLLLAKLPVLVKVCVGGFGSFFESEAFEALLEHPLDVGRHLA